MAFIDDIDPSTPAFNANVGEGDDQIRAFKLDVLQSFPNVGGAVTATQVELNYTLSLPADTNAELALKAPLTTPVFTTSIGIGAAVVNEAELEILDGATLSTTELNTLDGITATTTELNYTDGVTSAIQGQLNGKLANSGTKTVSGTTTFSGVTNFDNSVDIDGTLTVDALVNEGDGGYTYQDNPSNTSGKIRIQSGAASGGSNGDIWFIV